MHTYRSPEAGSMRLQPPVCVRGVIARHWRCRAWMAGRPHVQAHHMVAWHGVYRRLDPLFIVAAAKLAQWQQKHNRVTQSNSSSRQAATATAAA